MEVPQVLHMNEGEGEHSYHSNSLLQKKVILRIKPILLESIAQVCEKFKGEECLKMVDFGCSSGPNTLLPLWEIIQTMDSIFNRKPPTLQFFLNDLPGNDFNIIFRSLLPDFQRRLKKVKGDKFEHCFITAMPGSFYERLFPSKSLHFVFSSYSLHWCSQVPEGLVTESGMPLNKGNLCVAKSSPESVHEAYRNQFEKDFRKFLRVRWGEMEDGGEMVITFMAKSDKSPFSQIWQITGDTLKQMVDEGLIEESKLDNYNVPLYTPSLEEVRNVIKEERSFSIKTMQEFELSWDDNIEDGNIKHVFDESERVKYVFNNQRAVAEPMLATQFGDQIMDTLFSRLALKVADGLKNGTGLFHSVVVYLTKEYN